MLQSTIATLCLLPLSVLFAAPAPAADLALKPYLLGLRGPGTVESKLPQVKRGIEQKGLQIVGEYAPYPGALR